MKLAEWMKNGQLRPCANEDPFYPISHWVRNYWHGGCFNKLYSNSSNVSRTIGVIFAKQPMKIYRGLLLILMLPAFFVFDISCNKTSPQQADIEKSISLPTDGPAIIADNDQFAFDFLRAALQTDQSAGNKLISPLSIYLALSMVYNGADNATRDSIQLALRSQNISIDDLNKTCQALIQGMPLADNEVHLSIANAIFYNQNIQPVPGFLSLIQQYYLAKMDSLNFNDPQSVNTINQWVASNTNQKITQVLSNISPSDLMYLINALYFKGSWEHGFDPKATSTKTFYPTPTTTVSTAFMALNTSLAYFQNDSLQMIQLPYGAGDFNMYVLLPSANISLSAISSALNPPSFSSWQSQMGSRKVQLSFPKFSYSYAIADMRPALTLMGMGIAFGTGADFSGMYTIPVDITKAIHKTYIDVDEEGTEAAAVTVIGIEPTVAGPSEPIIINIDHPFIYIIQEKSSGAILFMGLMNDPSQSS